MVPKNVHVFERAHELHAGICWGPSTVARAYKMQEPEAQQQEPEEALGGKEAVVVLGTRHEQQDQQNL